MTLNGAGLGADSSSVAVSFGTISCTSVSFVFQETEFTCYVGSGSGATNNVNISISSVSASSLVTFSYQGEPLLVGPFYIITFL